MIIYGWEKLNKEEANFLELEIEDNEFKELFKIKDKITSEVLFKKAIDIAYQEGRWFLDKNEAKKAMINTLLEEIHWREDILKKLKEI